MTTTADEQLIRWAAKAYRIPGHQIERVVLSEDHAEGCDTCGYGGGITRHVRIELKDGRPPRIEEREDEYIDLLREILEAV